MIGTRRGLLRRPTALVAAVLGVSLVSGCSGSVYDLPLPGGPSVGDNPMTVHVRFRDVLDLVPNSLVKVNDVSVGKVTGIDLKGYTADVTLEIPDDSDLPDNTEATIRQTSLLGEKFVSLAPPADPEGTLKTGDTIPLSRSGRNPEVEEVFGALSLLLNGGGVAQLRTIARELNNAVGGREDGVRNTLEQLREFTGQLDARKQQVVDAIDSLNRLAIAAKKQDGTIKLTLDELPSAIASVNSQRADLVTTLQALDRLSVVGTRVIKETKANTITTLQDLGPVLDKLADAGSSLPRSVQVFLTYPFIDEAVGRNPVVARNIHFGDYVNLNVNLRIDQSFLSQGCKALFNSVATVLSEAGLKGTPLQTVATGVITQYITANGAGCDTFTTLTVDQLNAIRTLLSGLGATPLTDAAIQQLVTGLSGILGGSSATGSAGTGQSTTPDPSSGSPLAGLSSRRSNGGGVLGGLLGGSSSSSSSPAPTPSAKSSSSVKSGGSSSSGSSGGMLGNLFSGFGRSATGLDLGQAIREGNGQRGDALNGPVGTASQIGYNSTLGALLLQGVSTQ